MLNFIGDIGKHIVEKQKKEKWGDSVIEKLAQDLQNEFPGVKGFSARNLWNMRDLYATYHKSSKLQTVSAEISWSHNKAILEKCHDNLEREFYMRMTRKCGWSYRVLLNNIENQTYEKTLLGQTNFDATLPAEISQKSQPLAALVPLDVQPARVIPFDEFKKLGEFYEQRNALQEEVKEIDYLLHQYKKLLV